jgi:hypothetical protein
MVRMDSQRIVPALVEVLWLANPMPMMNQRNCRFKIAEPEIQNEAQNRVISIIVVPLYSH